VEARQKPGGVEGRHGIPAKKNGPSGNPAVRVPRGTPLGGYPSGRGAENMARGRRLSWIGRQEDQGTDASKNNSSESGLYAGRQLGEAQLGGGVGFPSALSLGVKWGKGVCGGGRWRGGRSCCGEGRREGGGSYREGEFPESSLPVVS